MSKPLMHYDLLSRVGIAYEDLDGKLHTASHISERFGLFYYSPYVSVPFVPPSKFRCYEILPLIDPRVPVLSMIGNASRDAA